MTGAVGWSSRLDAAFDHLWDRLGDAAGNPASPLRRLIVANTGPAGADARVMVLRACDRGAATLVFHTDLRSPKVSAFTADPRLALIGYDHAAAYQLRLRGHARIDIDGPVWAAALAALSPADHRNYVTVDAPGTPSTVPTDGQPPAGVPDSAPAHFARVVVTLDRIEWLDLAPAGHRRAAYARESGHWAGRWLIP